MHRLGSLAVKVDRADRVEGDRVVDESDAVLLADAEDVEVPAVGGQRHVEVDELLPVLVYVDREPAPLAVLVSDVEVVRVAVAPEVGGNM